MEYYYIKIIFSLILGTMLFYSINLILKIGRDKTLMTDILLFLELVTSIVLMFILCCLVHLNLFDRNKRVEIDFGKVGLAYVNSREYDKALEAFDKKLKEEPNDDEVTRLSAIVNDYITADNKLKESNFDEAKSILDNIDSQYVNYSIRNDIEKSNRIINARIKQIEDINSFLIEAERLYSSNNYKECIKYLESKLGKNMKTNQYILQEQVDKALELQNKCNDNIEQSKYENQQIDTNSNKVYTREEAYAHVKSLQSAIVDVRGTILVTESAQEEGEEIPNNKVINGEECYWMNVEFLNGDMPMTRQGYVSSISLKTYTEDGREWVI